MELPTGPVVPGRLRDKVAVVTGAASGIGLATALAMAREGARVVFADRKRDPVARAVERATAQGGSALAVGMDQTETDDVARLVADTLAAYGRIDILFANAGIAGLSPFLDIPEREWRRIIDVDLTGTFLVCQAVARQMVRQRHGGKIVVASSCAAQTVCDQTAAYSAAKAGVLMLAKTMASELGPYRINVNAILPGVVESGLTDTLLEDKRMRNMLTSQTPLGRWGRPEEVAALVLFLSSADADYINGETILIDGGATLHGAPRWSALDYRDENEADWQAAYRHYPYADRPPTSRRDA